LCNRFEAYAHLIVAGVEKWKNMVAASDAKSEERNPIRLWKRIAASNARLRTERRRS
jgi:hypothetical protein